MFDTDKWNEILSTIKKNKLRTILTAMSVAWGIFILVVLLGAGNGLQNGVNDVLSDLLRCTIEVYPARTSKEYAGLPINRFIEFNEATTENITNASSKIIGKTCFYSPRYETVISYKNTKGTYSVCGVQPNAIDKGMGIEIINGRFFNELDEQDARKVAIIGCDIVELYFNNVNPIGECIKINDTPVLIVGVYSNLRKSHYAEDILLPYSLTQRLYNSGKQSPSQYTVLVDSDISVDESLEIEKNIRTTFAKILNFDPTDESALYMYNSKEKQKQYANIVSAIMTLIWIISISTLVSGVIGVGNIMIVVVKERTREIGIRKALGARPWSIISLIFSESIFITALSGYFGMFLGMGVVKIIDNITASMNAAATGIKLFQNPTVDFTIIAGATLILVVCGAIAGLVPAIKASKIKPIDALRYE